MRIFVTLAAAPLLGAAQPSPVQPAAPMPVQNPYVERSNCPETPMSLALKQGANPQARPLNQLPPAQAFMAVDRRVNGCAAPLLMSEARTSR
jgi:hypothetical protein